jgi:hypothetical protein
MLIYFLASSSFNAYFDILVSGIVFLVVCFACFLHYQVRRIGQFVLLRYDKCSPYNLCVVSEKICQQVKNTGKANRCRNPRNWFTTLQCQRPTVQSCKHFNTPKDTKLCSTYFLCIGKMLGT